MCFFQKKDISISEHNALPRNPLHVAANTDVCYLITEFLWDPYLSDDLTVSRSREGAQIQTFAKNGEFGPFRAMFEYL